jgi:hypothetical protein
MVNTLDPLLSAKARVLLAAGKSGGAGKQNNAYGLGRGR